MALSQFRISKEFNIHLDLKKSVSNTEFEVVAGDTENFLNITLTNEGNTVSLFNTRVVAVFSHPEGTFIQDSALANSGISIWDNNITIRLKTESFTPGLIECELKLYSAKGELKTISTPSFNFSCRPSLITDFSLMSSDRFDTLTTLLMQATDAVAAANTAINLATEIPLIHVAYCEQNPVVITDAQLTNIPSNYMGISVGHNTDAPINPHDYTWINLHDTPQITSAQVTEQGELSLIMSNGDKVNTDTLSTYLNTLINTRPTLSGISVSPDGKLNLNMSDSTVLQGDISSYVSSVVSARPRAIGIDVAENGTMTLRMSDYSTLETSGLKSYVDTAMTEYQRKNIVLKNTVVDPSAFTETSGYPLYPYKAMIEVAGIESGDLVTVVFDTEDVLTENMAGTAKAVHGGIEIFAKTQPTHSLTIPFIKKEQA